MFEMCKKDGTGWNPVVSALRFHSCGVKIYDDLLLKNVKLWGKKQK